ncbi:hypothetical protein DL93DRAFT_2071062 [Clavulina sp. PMI_390]|nr:hypothetical protein DL93DRAFT_2071062 [Clavulina sp. PMI_390]
MSFAASSTHLSPPPLPSEDAKLFIAVGRTIYFYDFLLTFSDEVQYVWRSRPSFVKYLYLFCRYCIVIPMIFSIVDSSGFFSPSVQFCKVSYILQIGLYSFIFGGWNWLLAMRVHAIFGGGVMLHHIFTCASIIVAAIGSGLGLWEAAAMSRAMTVKYQTCTPGKDLPSTYWVTWVPTLCFNLAMFMVGMSKLLRRRYPSSCLRNLLIRDGFIYWVVISAMEVVNLVLYWRNNPATMFRFMYIYEGLGSTLVSRLVLNLRGLTSQTEIVDLDADVAKIRTNDRFVGGKSYHMQQIAVTPRAPTHLRAGPVGLNIRPIARSIITLQDPLGLESDDVNHQPIQHHSRLVRDTTFPDQKPTRTKYNGPQYLDRIVIDDAG